MIMNYDISPLSPSSGSSREALPLKPKDRSTLISRAARAYGDNVASLDFIIDHEHLLTDPTTLGPKLLTRDEEQCLFAHISRGLDIICCHPILGDLNEVASPILADAFNSLTNEEQMTLAHMTGARSLLARANEGLVQKAAHTFAPARRGTQLTHEDLVAEGSLKLVKLIDGFDPTKGTKFSTLAYGSLERAISDFITGNRGTIHIPKNVHRDFRRKQKALAGLACRQQDGNPSKEDFIAIGTTGHDFTTLTQLCAGQVGSLHSLVDPHKPASDELVDSLPTHDKTRDRIDDAFSIRQLIVSAALTPKEQFVIGLACGLTPNAIVAPSLTVKGVTHDYATIVKEHGLTLANGLPLTEVAKLLGFTGPTYVSKINSGALAKLQAVANANQPSR